jgi:hypothetical protein
MFRCKQTAGMVMLSFSILATPAIAETLRCQSINGNLNCAGSNGVSCQTVDGKKTCVSGHGDVVQSFGGGKGAADQGNAALDDKDSTGMDDSETLPVPHQRIERHDQSGRQVIIDRDGAQIHVRTNWVSIDRN